MIYQSDAKIIIKARYFVANFEGKDRIVICDYLGANAAAMSAAGEYSQVKQEVG